ncbi:helix-turn-helix domain-containing protein [Streptomyces sp. B1866]|uniref:AraC-like ligand-binding domain-containing protein n=1 Tax=Streptomyces sp. B1866 TaxID=3075431 RepID=UPI0028912789|nr:helix-turn-helix domain-containing protein [Streptomyces sp. B1866]MDT3397950.1 helix-turn-helix domain-containing protein [Streptomyces sp. B1866]
MTVIRYSTAGLPKADRFAWWHDMTYSALVATAMHTPHADGFHAAADVMDLGLGQITAMTYQPMTVERTPKLIRLSDPGYYQVSLTVHGSMGLAQSRRDVSFGPGDLVIYDSSRPFSGFAAAEPGAVKHIVAQVPQSLVPVRPDLLDRLVATRLPGDHGFARLLAHFLTQVTAQAHHYQPSDTPRLLTVLLDLLAATVAQHLDDPAALTPESRRHTLFLRIRAHIHRHLSDPDLSPARIAAAHHISLRTLHRLFRPQGTTVAAYIRHQRLQAAHRDLADPRLASRPIHAIATSWGFPRAEDFTRAFRTAYGIPPRDYRQTALRKRTGT